MGIKELKQEQHPAKAVFKLKDVPISAVAKAMNLSFTYVVNMLNGVTRVTPENEAKLQKIIESLELKIFICLLVL